MTKIEDFIAGRSPAEMYETYLVPGFFKPFAEQMIENAVAGSKYIDVACGTGIVSRTLAAKLDDNVSIDALDMAPPMIDVAKQQTVSSVVKYHLTPADALPFDDALFDGAFCQQGIQFFPAKEKAFEEIFRVLKPGGRFYAAIWLPAKEANVVFASFEKAIGRHLGEDLLPLGPFSFGNLERLRRLATDGGFNIETLESRTLLTVLPSIRDLVLFDVLFLGRPGADGSLQPVIRPNDPAGDEIVEQMIAEMTEDLEPYIGDDGRLYTDATTYFLAANK
ncbi:class I SAM-dependent methyltransferase [Hyphococcus flavus]|uniref:Class I SAM-dependent methyltransferase n=1 Tax=Hyphococcus flavus TaxID=1866326 RepID=A0AAF0CH99_9PROT|nr:class I SAM-dependent methyltransferase [Hyphococcus flavus]WDI31662.1 class I SAM-dependent methyltransferase [Hyphococcus flavus]